MIDIVIQDCVNRIGPSRFLANIIDDHQVEVNLVLIGVFLSF